MKPIVAAALEWKVETIAQHEVAMIRVKDLRSAERMITNAFERSRRAADTAKKEIIALRDKFIGPIKQARLTYDRQATAYEEEQGRIAREEEQRLQKEALKREEEKQLQDAIAADESGDTEQAEAILEERVEVPVVTVAPQVATVKGVSTRTSWSAEVTDMPKLVAYVNANPEWISLLLPNGPNLNRLAVSQHEALAIPGVKAVSQTVRSTRS